MYSNLHFPRYITPTHAHAHAHTSTQLYARAHPRPASSLSTYLITLDAQRCAAHILQIARGSDERALIISSDDSIAVIAAFMPTYSPFMMARFVSAIGIGGVFPCAASYLCEVTPLSGRARVTAFLGTIGISGGIFAGAVAMAIIPLTGQAVIAENRQEFSAWHRYLLLMTIVQIIGTILIFWLPESPRHLLGKQRAALPAPPYMRRPLITFPLG